MPDLNPFAGLPPAYSVEDDASPIYDILPVGERGLPGQIYYSMIAEGYTPEEARQSVIEAYTQPEQEYHGYNPETMENIMSGWPMSKLQSSFNFG